jgi:uncharacterized protein YegL
MTRKRSAQRVAVPTTVPTIIEFIIDESGSMGSVVDETISGFRSFLDEQKAAQGSALLSLTKFESNNLVTPYVDLDVNLVLPLTRETFVPAGGTNLRDALGSRVRNVEERIKSWTSPPQVLVVLLTDGQDNQSRQYSTPQVRDMIAAHEAQGWTFVYLGSDSRALEAAQAMGFQPGNSKKFEINEMHKTMETLSRATTAYRATSTAAASTSFFA